MYIPKECYKDFGSDLDGCSTQENEGCARCSYRKRREQEVTHAQGLNQEANTQ
ncbi:hypothetical protein SPSIL_015090 [Sporomusa silvacetica DSM 10669]|uniref:Uncharacterized protein n=1 Tax=Sporomusa silvacetica DSM 10669 TaxID=1123289 RepID=A0ABZ3IJ10_9FIRM|nr:hypothetical protein SPSIL_09820 [Sporomusa silvacetica DSM 10669]